MQSRAGAGVRKGSWETGLHRHGPHDLHPAAPSTDRTPTNKTPKLGEHFPTRNTAGERDLQVSWHMKEVIQITAVPEHSGCKKL